MTLPRLGQGMESGTIVRWLKQEGDRVEKGEALYELDTEKVTQEVEAEASGVVLKILAAEGDEVEVGKAVVVIGEEGEEVETPAEEPKREEPKAEQTQREPEPEPPAERVETPDIQRADGRIKASPLARRIARERGIDLARVRGTGPEGRIVAEDVERAEVAPAAAGAPAVPGEVERVELFDIDDAVRLAAHGGLAVVHLRQCLVERLHEADQQLEKVERNRQQPPEPRDHRRHRLEHVLSCENVAVEPEAQ